MAKKILEAYNYAKFLKIVHSMDITHTIEVTEIHKQSNQEISRRNFLYFLEENLNGNILLFQYEKL